MFASIAAVGAVVGGLLSGKLNNRFGSKPLAVIFAPIACISGILLTCSPNLFMSVFFWVIVAFATSIATTALFVLLLKLIPSYKGTTMSVSAVFQNLGFIFGLIMGGSILNSFDNNFIALTIILGITGVISLPFFHLFIRYK
jgi:MFS family permease